MYCWQKLRFWSKHLIINVNGLLVKDVSVCLISSCQVACEGRSAQPISADSLLCAEASWDSSQCKQTEWPANTPPTASLLYRSPLSASLLGISVPQHSTPDPNTNLVWKAQSEGIAGWVSLSVLLNKFYHNEKPVQMLSWWPFCQRGGQNTVNT